MNQIYNEPIIDFPNKIGYYWIKGKTLANTEINCIGLVSFDIVHGYKINIQGKEFLQIHFYNLVKEIKYWKINEPE